MEVGRDPSPYPVGGINFTGDEAVVLTCDGPSLGGFVAFATVVLADLWKMGQVHPGDKLQFVPVTPAKALAMISAVDTKTQRIPMYLTFKVEVHSSYLS